MMEILAVIYFALFLGWLILDMSIVTCLLIAFVASIIFSDDDKVAVKVTEPTPKVEIVIPEELSNIVAEIKAIDPKELLNIRKRGFRAWAEKINGEMTEEEFENFKYSFARRSDFSITDGKFVDQYGDKVSDRELNEAMKYYERML